MRSIRGHESKVHSLNLELDLHLLTVEFTPDGMASWCDLKDWGYDKSPTSGDLLFQFGNAPFRATPLTARRSPFYDPSVAKLKLDANMKSNSVESLHHLPAEHKFSRSWRRTYHVGHRSRGGSRRRFHGHGIVDLLHRSGIRGRQRSAGRSCIELPHSGRSDFRHPAIAARTRIVSGHDTRSDLLPAFPPGTARSLPWNGESRSGTVMPVWPKMLPARANN